jgi:hypothetical protein
MNKPLEVHRVDAAYVSLPSVVVWSERPDSVQSRQEKGCDSHRTRIETSVLEICVLILFRVTCYLQVVGYFEYSRD